MDLKGIRIKGGKEERRVRSSIYKTFDDMSNG
jgi:hypothetical protein